MIDFEVRLSSGGYFWVKDYAASVEAPGGRVVELGWTGRRLDYISLAIVPDWPVYFHPADVR